VLFGCDGSRVAVAVDAAVVAGIGAYDTAAVAEFADAAPSDDDIGDDSSAYDSNRRQQYQLGGGEQRQSLFEL
jgi:hypothetical protein